MTTSRPFCGGTLKTQARVRAEPQNCHLWRNSLGDKWGTNRVSSIREVSKRGHSLTLPFLGDHSLLSLSLPLRPTGLDSAKQRKRCPLTSRGTNNMVGLGVSTSWGSRWLCGPRFPSGKALHPFPELFRAALRRQLPRGAEDLGAAWS